MLRCLPPLLLLHLLSLPWAGAQPRAAQLACRGLVLGQVCSYSATDGIADAADAGGASNGVDKAITWGHCYNLERWRDGGAGTKDFTGTLRLETVAACLTDGPFTHPQGDPLPKNATQNGFQTQTAAGTSRGADMVAWVARGGWRVIAASAAALYFAVCLCSCVAVRFLREKGERADFVSRVPVVLGVGGTARTPWRVTRAVAPWAVGRRGRGSLPWSAAARSLGHPAVGRQRLRRQRRQTRDPRFSLPPPPPREPPPPSDHYDIDAELRAAGLVYDDAVKDPSLLANGTTFVANKESLPQGRQRKSLRPAPPPPMIERTGEEMEHVPQLCGPPLPVTPVGSAKDRTGAQGLGIHGPPPAPRSLPCPPDEEDDDPFSTAQSLAMLEQAVSLSARGHHCVVDSWRHVGAREDTSRVGSAPRGAPIGRGSDDRVNSGSDDEALLPIIDASHSSTSSALGDATRAAQGGSGRRSRRSGVHPARSKWDNMEDDLCRTLEDEETSRAMLSHSGGVGGAPSLASLPSRSSDNAPSNPSTAPPGRKKRGSTLPPGRGA